MGFSKEGQVYRVYYIVHLLIPQEGYIDVYYLDVPTNEQMIDDIIQKKEWLEMYKGKIQILNWDPLLDKHANG